MSSTIFSDALQNPHFDNVQDITPEQLKGVQNEVAIIDVREDHEWTGELGHINTAQLIKLSTIPENVAKIPKDKTVVMVCRSGGRSAQATAYLKQQGYENIYNMRGGMIQWNQLGLPVSQD